MASGASTGELAVTSAAGGGVLSGQSVRIVNNFANVAEQVITFSGGESTRLAVGNAVAVPAGGSPVDLGRFRVGVTAPSRSFEVTNTTTGAGAEHLGIGSVTMSANFAASGVSSALIAPGATQSPGFTLGVSGGAAGVNTGFAGIQYVSNGQMLDPTFTNVTSNLQDVAAKATGYALANLAAGGVNSAALSVKLNTSTVGSFSASVPVLFKSNGAGTSGFGLLDPPTQAHGRAGRAGQ